MPNDTSDAQGRPHPHNRPTEREGDLPEPTPGLMPDLRGQAAEQGRDPEEVDPVSLDEDALRRMSSDAGVKLP